MNKDKEVVTGVMRVSVLLEMGDGCDVIEVWRTRRVQVLVGMHENDVYDALQLFAADIAEDMARESGGGCRVSDKNFCDGRMPYEVEWVLNV